MAQTESQRFSDGLLRCRRLEIGYSGRALLPPLDLEIRRGELWVVLGRNGSGKTALVRTLLGLCPPVRGSVESMMGRSLSLACVAQRSELDTLYPLSARDVVALGTERRWSFLRPRANRDALERALGLVGVSALGERLFRDLSEGERQRVLLARVVASSSDLGLLDEPTAALDLVAERESFRVMHRLTRDTGLSLVVVTHSVRFANEYADRAVLLDRDTPAVVAGSAREVLAHSSFRKSFGTAAVEVSDA